jgi:hypothetical protein
MENLPVVLQIIFGLLFVGPETGGAWAWTLTAVAALTCLQMLAMLPAPFVFIARKLAR